MPTTPETIHRKDYPELDLILWDYAAETIDAEVAFGLYERRWRYINPQDLTPKEKALIDHLTTLYGKGLFLSA